MGTLGCLIWGLRYLIWGLRCLIWGLRCLIWGLRCPGVSYGDSGVLYGDSGVSYGDSRELAWALNPKLDGRWDWLGCDGIKSLSADLGSYHPYSVSLSAGE